MTWNIVQRTGEKRYRKAQIDASRNGCCDMDSQRWLHLSDFVQNFLTFYNIFVITGDICCASDFEKLITLSQPSPGFMFLHYKSFENTAGKEKLIITSNISFTHSVFYQFEELSSIFIKFEIVVCNLFQFGRV